ncbi:unnamed protein product [Blepharisma stoltei]|uniref:Uncharacterized protein n=1 Tax=Blepharisma stoltei TaxID=1481888 RepID=A0AAU9JUE3_9CILI|nr:unnamed protein product [Blepharisma stoltei]
MDLSYEQLHMLEEDSRDDCIKLRCISCLVKRYASFSIRKPKRRVTHMTVQLIPELNSEDSRHLSINSIFTNIESRQREYEMLPEMTRSATSMEDRLWISDKTTYSKEEYIQLQQNFMSLFFEHKPYHGSRIHKSVPEIHRSNVIQFFLDSWVLSQNVFLCLLVPLKNKVWVDMKTFISAIECASQFTYEKSNLIFRVKDLEKSINEIVQKQYSWNKISETFIINSCL